MALRIYNTLTRQTEEFAPIEPGKVSMYVCGPTVYADAHIGHAMAAIIFDTVRRYLTYQGYRVRFVTNFTDVDDKIIRRANEQKRDPIELANHYADEYLRHLRDLNVLEADVYPRVSEEMGWITQMIGGLEEEGYAYRLDGDVYFRVKRDADYGRLSGRRLEEAMSGTRVEEDARKEHPGDFALWKSAKPGEPSWESPFGPGRPGWHIECSAMCLHHLGEVVDIHGGGNDLIFPHHENEIAQSESYTGKEFARYWMHNGMLQLAGEKMSKSLGNLITIDQFLKEHGADALRLLIFTGHYRKPVVYSAETVESAERSLARLRSGLRPAQGNASTGEAADKLRVATEEARAGYIAAMDDDFNTAGALATLFELVRAINTARTAGVTGPFYDAAQQTLRELAGILGITLEEPAAAAASDVAARPFIDLLVAVRGDLRTARQWALADKVRDGLKGLGVTLEDSPDGTNWRFESE
ncbi:MAG: cysteine--tRNA ligase [Caldilinea sp.]|nr:cysteine--tRNA ligase [Caldilinea sp.]